MTEDQELQEKFAGIAVSMEEFLKPEFVHIVRETKASYRRSKV